MSNSNKRSRLFADSSVQGVLLRRIALHWALFFGVACLCVLALQTMFGDPTHSVAERLQIVLSEFSLTALILLTLLPAFMLDTIRLTNRFVGPITRLRGGLRDLGKNQETRKIAFRDNDLWIDVAEEFNDVLAVINAQRDEIKALKEGLESHPNRARLLRTEEIDDGAPNSETMEEASA